MKTGYYHCDTSNLNILVLNVVNESEDDIVLHLCVCERHGYPIEDSKDYKIEKKNIRHWKEGKRDV